MDAHAQTPLVEMKDISLAFGGLKAVDDASIDLYPGEVVGLLGHNGAGKSCLIKVLSGAYKRDSGHIYINGEEAGSDRIEATVPLIFSADETTDIGRDTASPVSEDYTAESSIFRGTINWVQIDVGEAAEDEDHLVTSEERMRILMARQ